MIEDEVKLEIDFHVLLGLKSTVLQHSLCHLSFTYRTLV